jgi:hypothetical protein
MRLLGTFDVDAGAGGEGIDGRFFPPRDEAYHRPDAVRLFPFAAASELAQPAGSEGRAALDVAFRWLEVVGPLGDEWPGRGHRLLFAICR